MKKIFLLLCLFMLTFSQISNAQMNDTAQNKFSIKSLYAYAIQEDVKKILSVLDTLPDSKLSEEDKLIKQKYYIRFNSVEENFDYKTTDALITAVIDIYRNYWTLILLKKESIDAADTILHRQLSEYLIKNYSGKNKWNEQEIKSDPMKYFSALLSEKKYFNNVDGKTGNLFDIYIWQRQDTVNYDVKLVDGIVNVPVLFMKDIITLGWEEYATFGYAYPGGWPKENSLYCVAKAYDTTKETFYISYLTHEAQHFFDLKTFEEIPSWHLEYRAKLAELAKADETLKKLLTYFTKGAMNDSTLSHPYAGYCVIRDLSKLIFEEEFVTESEKWNTVSNEEINKQAALLLKADSDKLTKKKF